MYQEKNTIAGSQSFKLASKVKDYFQLIKFTLSFMVVFSTVVSFLIVTPAEYNVNSTYPKLVLVLLLFAAGMLITGSANAVNQALEKDTDSLMKRTASRPVASGRMSVKQAFTFAFLAGALGCGMMWYFFNFSSAALSLFCIFLYGFIYTPLKKVNSIAVLVGALPGALPCLIGWVAGTNAFTAGGWILFAIQFLWQFPHFWAIAWVAHGDYSKAGFKLLPSDKGPTKFTALQSIMYSVMMIPVGLLPAQFQLTGVISMVIILICNLAMVFLCIRLYSTMSVKSARMVMFGSYFYLMIVFLSMYADPYKTNTAEKSSKVQEGDATMLNREQKYGQQKIAAFAVKIK